MIELDHNSYILGFWYAHDPKSGNDWMLCMQRHKETKKWKGDYRFRHKKDNKIFGSEDEKRWFEMKLNEEHAPGLETDQQMMMYLDGVFEKVIRLFPDGDKLIVQGYLPDMLEKAKTKPWMHIGGDGRNFELLKGGKK